jgi:hypothetical protein
VTNPCDAILANRDRCTLPAGHGGRHHWVPKHRPPEDPRRLALEELAAGQWPGEPWADWNARVAALVQQAQRDSR